MNRAALGLALILHGMANMVLPLRGADAATSGLLLPPVTALYAVAILGFVVTGLGVLGLRPLTHYIVPISLVAGVAGLAAQFWNGHGDLWPGVVISAALPILVTLFAASTGPGADRGTRPLLRAVGRTMGWGFLAWITATVTLWPWHRSWGTTPIEWSFSLPGDQVPRSPGLEIMHAVTIDAPPDAVWPWLMQLGQDRGGFYSYAWLERAFGAHITNAEVIRPEWQLRRVGDRVYATQAGYLGGIFGERPGWTIEYLQPPQALVLDGWGSFVLTTTADGRTRLLIRSTISNERIPTWAAAANLTLFELPHFIMQRRMMLGIKERAERSTLRAGLS